MSAGAAAAAAVCDPECPLQDDIGVCPLLADLNHFMRFSHFTPEEPRHDTFAQLARDFGDEQQEQQQQQTKHPPPSVLVTMQPQSSTMSRGQSSPAPPTRGVFVRGCSDDDHSAMLLPDPLAQPASMSAQQVRPYQQTKPRKATVEAQEEAANMAENQSRQPRPRCNAERLVERSFCLVDTRQDPEHGKKLQHLCYHHRKGVHCPLLGKDTDHAIGHAELFFHQCPNELQCGHCSISAQYEPEHWVKYEHQGRGNSKAAGGGDKEASPSRPIRQACNPRSLAPSSSSSAPSSSASSASSSSAVPAAASSASSRSAPPTQQPDITLSPTQSSPPNQAQQAHCQYAAACRKQHPAHADHIAHCAMYIHPCAKGAACPDKVLKSHMRLYSHPCRRGAVCPDKHIYPHCISQTHQ